MISLLVAFAILIIGYLLYSRVTQKIFAADDRVTPAVEKNDGVDCVAMKTWKAFLCSVDRSAFLYKVASDLMNFEKKVLCNH